MGALMFYHYCTLEENIEVMHTPLDETGHTLVHIEIPDEKYCFRQMDCLVPSFKVTNVVGISKEEVDKYVQFCRYNAHLLLKYAKCGGIEKFLN